MLQRVAVYEMGTNSDLISSNASPAVLTCFGVCMDVHANMSEILLCVCQIDNTQGGWRERENLKVERETKRMYMRERAIVCEREHARMRTRTCTCKSKTEGGRERARKTRETKRISFFSRRG